MYYNGKEWWRTAKAMANGKGNMAMVMTTGKGNGEGSGITSCSQELHDGRCSVKLLEVCCGHNGIKGGWPQRGGEKEG